jgi:hypothetical protein
MEFMENYFNLRKREEGNNGSSRTTIGANYKLPDKLGTGVLGYTWLEARDAILGVLDHQAPRVRIKSETDAIEKIMGYERLNFIELCNLRAALREKRPDIQFD